MKACLSFSSATLLALVLFLSACKKEESTYTGPITISKVYLEDAQSSVPDREVSFARLGQLLRIEGTGFTDLKRVYINGYNCYFNPVMVSNNSLLVSVDKSVPIIEASLEVRNTIRLSNNGNETTIEFEIRASAPSINKISNTLPKAGDTITVYGSGLLEVTSVLFPGNVEVTNGIISNEEGEFFTVQVPEGVAEEGGSIFIQCANGGAYSPAYFNFTKGVILNFDGVGTHGYWGEANSMITPDDLKSEIIGEGIVSDGIYVPHRPERIDTIKAASVRVSEVWTAGNDVDDWRGQLTPYIPAETSADDVAFQFDIYVPEDWAGSGFLKICLVNSFNGGEWSGNCYNYVPWLENGEAVPYSTTGWTTVTVPFSQFYAFKDGDFTFEDILLARESADWKNFGIYFENADFNLSNVTGNDADNSVEFPSSATQINVYTDNWRVVSIARPEYSDFPDEE